MRLAFRRIINAGLTGAISLAGLILLIIGLQVPVTARAAQSTDYPAPPDTQEAVPTLDNPYPDPGLETPEPENTLTPTGTPVGQRSTPTSGRVTRSAAVTGSPFPNETSTKVASPGTNYFLTENAEISMSRVTPPPSETPAPTHSPTITRTPTITLSPTPTAPSANTPSDEITTLSADSDSDSWNWKILGIGFAIPILLAIVGALILWLHRKAG